MRASLLVLAAATALYASSSVAAPAASSSSGPPDESSAPSSAKTGASTDTSATAGAFTVGMPVKDNTGATIGSIASLTTNASGKPAAVIKMGSDQFQVETAKLNPSAGAAVINLSQAQITSILHRSSSGSAAPNSGATGGGTGPDAPKP